MYTIVPLYRNKCGLLWFDIYSSSSQCTLLAAFLTSVPNNCDYYFSILFPAYSGGWWSLLAAVELIYTLLFYVVFHEGCMMCISWNMLINICKPLVPVCVSTNLSTSICTLGDGTGTYFAFGIIMMVNISFSHSLLTPLWLHSLTGYITSLH